MQLPKQFAILLTALAVGVSFTGCGAKAKTERHLKRGNELFAKKD